MSKLQQLVPIKRAVKNFRTGEDYTIESVDESFKISRQDIIDITEVCNEALIYDFLFRKKLNGEAYSNTGAFGFINFAWNGWLQDDKYVFLIRNAQGNIVGAIDIKSNNLDDAEIGYWLSKDASGVMTNAINEIVKIASESGYQKLFALIRPENHKSQGAVKRAGFIEAGELVKNDTQYIRFEKSLTGK